MRTKRCHVADDPKLPLLKSRTEGRSIAVDFPTGQKALFVEFAIECPVCGPHKIRIAGHHLRAMRDFLISTIDQYPERCGTEPERHELDGFSFKGGGGQG